MWKSTIVLGITILTSIKCFPQDNETPIIEELRGIRPLPPSLETGKKVAEWTPEDKVNPEELGESYIEGDIIFNKPSLFRNGMLSPSSRWTNGIVPYKISDEYNYKDYNTIMSAIEDYHKLTCVKWVRWSGEPDYVEFVPKSTGCWSSVGKVGGRQEINLQSPGCLSKKGTVLHEMLHALGFLHEQNRSERDNFVTINWKNIQTGRENNFQKASSSVADAFGVPYDYGSVMHYSAHAFSSNGKPTIVPKKKVELGQREGLSKGDIKKLRIMYNCGADGETTWNVSHPNFQSFRLFTEESLTWNVDPEELPHIPDHWFNFSAPHPLVNYTLGFLYFIFFVVSLAGNGVVIWIFSTSKSLQTPSNVFVVNLAICDFIMMSKTPIMIYNSMKLGFAGGQFWCQVYGVAGALSGIGASATNACIAYDRFETITNPLQKNIGKAKAIIICSLVWIYAMPWAILPAMEVWGKFVPEGFLTTCTFDYLSDNDSTRSFVASIFTCSYVLPMSLIIYFYTKIVIHVVKHEKSLKDQAKKMNVESLRSNTQKNQAAEIRIAKAAVTMCFLFVLSWTPYGIMALIGCFGNKNLITPMVSMIPACTCKTVACVDPYIYAISHPRFRVELRKRFKCLTGCIEESQSDIASRGTEVGTLDTPT